MVECESLAHCEGCDRARELIWFRHVRTIDQDGDHANAPLQGDTDFLHDPVAGNIKAAVPLKVFRC